MTDEQLQAVCAAAEAAPQDVWRYEPTGQTVWAGNTYMVADIRGWGHLQYLPNGEKIQDATGVHIATANPATVLALCNEIRRLQKEVESEKELRQIDAHICQSEIKRLNIIIDNLDGMEPLQ